MLFDCLAASDGKSLVSAPLVRRREALQRLHAGEDSASLLLSPFTDDREAAQSWLDLAGGALDGVVAKALEGPYEPASGRC
jgi:ATP-dependent DNA ligase